MPDVLDRIIQGRWLTKIATITEQVTQIRYVYCLLTSLAMNSPALSVCISLKNRSKVHHVDREFNLFPNCVTSLAQAAQSMTEIGSIELVVADFGSEDWPLSEWLDGAAGPLAVQIIPASGQFSRGLGLNLAAQHARCEQLFLCDADILVDATALRRAIEVLHNDQVWFPICRYADEEGHTEFWQEHGFGLVALTKQMLNQAGGVPEFESWGGEDVILQDALARRFKVVRDRSSGLTHQWHPDHLRDQHYTKARHADYWNRLKSQASIASNNTPLQTFHGEHLHWQGNLHLYSNGRMARQGVDAGDYEWEREKRLLLQWDRWPAEELFWDERCNVYCSQDKSFSLTPVRTAVETPADIATVDSGNRATTKNLSRAERRALKDLADLSKAFEQQNIRWSLQGGSVLGFYRDGGFFAQETDVDIVVLAEDWSEQVNQAAQQLGFNSWVHHECPEDNGLHICWQRKNHPWVIEVYPTYQATFGGKRLRYNGGDRYWRYYLLPRHVEETRLVDFLGVPVRIPEDTDGYLQWLYGETYRTPITDSEWDWVKQPGARAWNLLHRMEMENET